MYMWRKVGMRHKFLLQGELISSKRNRQWRKLRAIQHEHWSTWWLYKYVQNLEFKWGKLGRRHASSKYNYENPSKRIWSVRLPSHSALSCPTFYHPWNDSSSSPPLSAASLQLDLKEKRRGASQETAIQSERASSTTRTVHSDILKTFRSQTQLNSVSLFMTYDWKWEPSQ